MNAGGTAREVSGMDWTESSETVDRAKRQCSVTADSEYTAHTNLRDIAYSLTSIQDKCVNGKFNKTLFLFS